MRWRALAVVLAIAAATGADAHDRSLSYSSWELDQDGARVSARLSETDLLRIPWVSTDPGSFEQELGLYLSSRLHLLSEGEPCPPAAPPRRLETSAGRVRMEWRVVCPEGATRSIESRLFLDVAASHLHIARIERGEETLERVLSADAPEWLLGTADGKSQLAGATLAGYVALGVEHILTGYDHLVFVLALLLLGSAFLEVAKIVTGFTVAHSLTLALAATGILEPEAASIEALIGLSIALVAAENLWLRGDRGPWIPLLVAGSLAALAFLATRGIGAVPSGALAGLALFSLCYFGLLERARRPESIRWAVAFVFGLVHGFGFAGVLAEAELPRDRLVQGLLGFNVGVELGQLAVVAVVWPVLRLLVHRTAGGGWIADLGSAAVTATGVFWFVSRAYG